MKNTLFVAILFALLACGNHSHNDETASHTHAVLDATIYSHNLELFVQYDEFIAGHTSSVVAYVTNIPSFKPYKGGAIDISLSVGKSTINNSVEPHKEGVYSFNMSPAEAGEGVLIFTIDGQRHSVPVHIVGGDHHHHHDEAHSHENNISFGKEQSWKIDFATMPVAKSAFNGAVKVAAQVTATPDNFTTLVAPSAGKVEYAGNVVEGDGVQAGRTLFLLDAGNVTENDAAVKFAEAESAYNVAKSDYERKKELYNDDIISKREFENAEALFVQAEARYNSVKNSFSSGKSAVRSSINGYVSSLLVHNGDYVQAGTPLAVIQRDGDMNISAELPVRYASLLKNISDVNIELPCGKVCTAGELGAKIVAGTAVNSRSMLPVTVTAKHIGGVVAGSIVTLYLSSQMQGVERVTVPRSALVEEMGNLFVFVQHTPVSFEKRQVTVGATDGLRVQILNGLNEGERVVTKGAVSLKLSQGAAAVDPHAGHVH